jgi:uncharacterized membrane protein
MTLTATAVESRPAVPHLRHVLGRVAATLATAVVAPAVLFAATLVVFNITTAILVALAWTTAAMGWRRATGRAVSGLLLLVWGIMILKTAFTLATGNTFVYFAQPVVVDLTVGAVFLGSLMSARPIVARIAPDFYPINDELAARPGIQGLFRGLTLMWGLVVLVKGSLTLWLLLSLSTVNFVLIKGSAVMTLTLVTAATTVACSVVVGRREGLLAPAALRPATL